MRKYVPHLAISAAAAAIIALCCLIYWPYSTTVVLVVRHAERNDAESCPAPDPASTCQLPSSSSANPPLFVPPAGQIARADELRHVVEQTGIQAVYASCFCRTQQTVQPTATDYGLTINSVPQITDADITNLAEQINTINVGQKVLVAGHSDTVDKIIRELGGSTIDPIEGWEFDNLYEVTITRGWWRWWGWGKRVRVVRLKYGVESTPTPTP